MPTMQIFSTFKIHFALIIMAGFMLGSCDLASNFAKADREGEMEMQDFRDGMASRVESPIDETEEAKDRASIPELQPYISQSDAKMKSMPLVSVSVNQSVPVRDILFELAQQANYDIELDPRIRGSIIFTARDRPFDQVVGRIADIAGLRYNFDNDVLRVELDKPYNELYKIDYISYIRKSKSGINNNVAVVTGDGVGTGSNYEATSETEANFWGELESNLEQIINGTPSGGLKTTKDPRITATDQNPDVQAISANADGSVNVQAPQATLRVDSLPIDDEEQRSGNKANAVDERGSFTMNKQAGIVNVYAPERAHKEIRNYLKLLKKAVSAQVLIEAKLLEVTLNDEFVTGIDWGGISLFSGEFQADFLSNGTSRAATSLVPATAAGLTGASIATGTNFVLGYSGNDVQTLIQALSGFGTVKALASPRLTVLNNQTAVLNVATNQVFFDIDVDVTATDGGATQTDISSDIRNVPEGVLVNVQPSINLEDQTISLAVRPTITRVVNEVPDPAIQFVTASAKIEGVQSLVPELSVQEIDSVIQVRSGQPVVMGGLLQDRVVNSESGVPILSETPFLGNLFKDRDDLIQKTELVIFLKATILDSPSDSVHNTDKDLYRKFSSDRRPLRF